MRIEASKTETISVDAEFTSVDEFREKHAGFTIEAIDDCEVVTICEGCMKVIYEGDSYHATADDCDLCEICWAQAVEDGDDGSDDTDDLDPDDEEAM